MTEYTWIGEIIMNKYTPVFVFLLICFMFCLTEMGCTTAPNGAINAQREARQSGYELDGFHGRVHRYEEDIKSLTILTGDTNLAQFCMNHYVWETITVRLKRDENGNHYRDYIVGRK